MTVDSRPPSKKTEMIEVRVSHETKRDFLAACRLEGRTASDVVRESVDTFIRGEGRLSVVAQPEARRPIFALIPAPLRRKRYLAIGAAAAGLTVLAALPSAAQPHDAASSSCAQFEHVDANHDGQLSLDEFTPRS
jgi:DNA-binding IclR family transcriptional regulator